MPKVRWRHLGPLLMVGVVPVLVFFAVGNRPAIGLATGLIIAVGAALGATCWLEHYPRPGRGVLEEHLARLGSLSEAGQLAASMAHEVRNPLTSIKGFLQLMQARITDPTLLEYSHIMTSEVDRAVTLVTDFLELARPAGMHPEPTDLHALVRQVINVVEGQAFLQNVSINEEFASSVPLVDLDRKQIKQVLLNLLHNGLEAMPEGGTITLRTNVDKPGSRVLVQVADTGPGIAPEILDKIGQPFITTKEKGTGLGLAISCHIMQEHGGKLEAYSVPGQSTTFTLIFPLS